MRELLQRYKAGDLDLGEVVSSLRTMPYQDLGFAKVDHHRPLRTGFPEVVFGKGKTPLQVKKIVASLFGHGHPVLVTKTNLETFELVAAENPYAEFQPAAQMITISEPMAQKVEGIFIVTAGTADLPIAEEARITAELMGGRVTQINDVGIAGLPRLIDVLPDLEKAKIIILVAGMEAALAGVVAGLVSVPIIAVPTSVGYGSSFEGLAALLGMLNSCAPGISVVNIDNGFGAGYLAVQMLRTLGQP
ncbi:MAG: nickel pincer cofactor biosynthesis protein LarB [Chloroflexota bacterium]|nr:nickel pincer cofactor biosynthesis protein LarB [Chloroflexota bacterium]